MIIKGGTVVNEGRMFPATVIVDGETIAEVREEQPGEESLRDNGVHEVIDATGCYILPGVIDEHVHFREPGLTHKADIDTESQAAAAGGVTTFFDMPNCIPQTTTTEALEEKFALAASKSHVNYSFFFGATHDNAHLFPDLDPHRIPGIKLFMGSSTGNMLVDDEDSLERIFRDSPLPLMTHCEDTAIINSNMARCKEQAHTDDPPLPLHHLIRSREACIASTRRAVALAQKYGTRLHIAHLSTKDELDLLAQSRAENITAEACVGHLVFNSSDIQALGARIKVNPAIKETGDQKALLAALADGSIAAVATDHAPHCIEEKNGGCQKAASGMPLIQFSLVAMLGLVDRSVITLPRLVQLMAHSPAQIFGVRGRGFLRAGYKADIAIVRPSETWTITDAMVLSKCGWTPLAGTNASWRVEKTLCNGHLVYDHGVVDTAYIAQPVEFR